MTGRREPRTWSVPLKNYILIAVVAGVVLSEIPYKTITVPAWRIRFTDESGMPFRALPVNQTWRNYSVESSDHHAGGMTDENGYAQFPERSVWAPLVMRVLGPIKNMLGAGAHASFGSSGWIMTSCDLMERGSRLAAYYGTDLPDHITLGYFGRGNIRRIVPMSVDPRCKQQEEQAKNEPSVNARTEDARQLADQVRRNELAVSDADIQLLADMLSDRDDSVRYWIAMSLGYIGPRTRPAVPALGKALEEVQCAHGSKTSADAIRLALTKIEEAVRHHDCS